MSGIYIGDHYRLVPTRHGSMLVNRNDIYMGQSYLHYGECCEDEIQLLLQLTNSRLALPGVVVEVGSNMGVHTVPVAADLARQGRKMLAIEPQPVIFQQLCANLALNGLMNVVALPYACGTTEMVLSFPKPDYGSAGNFGGTTMALPEMALPGTVPQSQGMQAVHCYPLDTLIREQFPDQPVALIKIDAEGFELMILQGAREILDKFHPVLYVENDRLDKSEALIRWLQGQGYRLWWHITRLFRADNFNQEPKNIYENVVLVNMVCLHPVHGATIATLTEILDPAKHPLKREFLISADAGAGQMGAPSDTPYAAAH